MLPEVGVPELLLIGVIALIVVGPKDLPVLMRKVGKFLAHMRGMAAEFRASFDEMARQSELDELRREVEEMRRTAQQPGQVAMESIGLGEIGQGLNEANSEIHSRLVVDPHETPQPHVGALGEPLDEAPAAQTEPEPPPASKPKRRAKPKKADSTVGPDDTPPAEAPS